MRHLILTLEAPLMAFGGETVDNYGVTRWFPAASMLAGLLANALGWRRIEHERHQALQDRLIFAARIDRGLAEGGILRDFQTAQLGAKDRAWTSHGRPEGRAGGARTYDAPHLRYRDYLADMRVTVALRFEPEAESPALDNVAHALQRPARPLFIGRKPCLPSTQLFTGFCDADSALAALRAIPVNPDPDQPTVRVLWPDGDGSAGVSASRRHFLTDQRNWASGLHGGGRVVCESELPCNWFGPSTGTPDA
ncbi:MAG: type I-E CRISPR-associated protein Cas5/CasD [Chloroflexi bacterium]|nr:type I-E CRISPR-associated protein Cas5/CasD [Chloroflexota bacterium]